jgi:glyoxylase-like metal-dependent hydrolase (beta-lactamase superfamily II)
MKIYSILGNEQKLDGGAMFGNVPKAMWSKWWPADELNRIHLTTRCLLLEMPDKLVLFETGIGSFFSPLMKDRFGVYPDDHVLLRSLKAAGKNPEDITDIVVSHLHFDHVGGILNSYVEGAPLSLAFPRANIYVGEKAYERALKPHPRDRASFIEGLCPLLEQSGRLKVIRHENDRPLGPCVSFRFSQGHTPGLTLSTIHGKNDKITFVSDLIPGAPWVHAVITMGYDRYPELLIEEKQKLLDETVLGNDYLFFTHDPEVAMAKIKKDAKGKFECHSTLKEIHGWELF